MCQPSSNSSSLVHFYEGVAAPSPLADDGLRGVDLLQEDLNCRRCEDASISLVLYRCHWRCRLICRIRGHDFVRFIVRLYSTRSISRYGTVRALACTVKPTQTSFEPNNPASRLAGRVDFLSLPCFVHVEHCSHKSSVRPRHVLRPQVWSSARPRAYLSSSGPPVLRACDRPHASRHDTTFH